MNLTGIVRRSPLIMPVNRPRFVEKAYLRGADAIVPDAERSRRVTEAFEEGVAHGTASVWVDGRTSGMPIAEKAHRLLARACHRRRGRPQSRGLRTAGVT